MVPLLAMALLELANRVPAPTAGTVLDMVRGQWRWCRGVTWGVAHDERVTAQLVWARHYEAHDTIQRGRGQRKRKVRIC